MSMSDPIADLLTRIRNGLQAQKPSVDVPRSQMKVAICRVLKEQGYIAGFEELDNTPQGTLRIALKYLPDRRPVLQGVRRISKPSLRVYMAHSELKPVRSGLGISIVSTSKGVMTGKQARAENVGGELICEVW
ncbi:MAG TPA: 30S ribosomal protein S8 [Candidatus Hydrogenedentes bacterium]|jgi:small subunit ribosomal protein S8|nr:MAG: 30S ribosomal protein S8 [Candidatus Hydrogenedentes bacterium ADurb.Bin170]HNZ49250.1 30S ribosomal protein S8 [Candidatus Hydrogenedentota bacterium]HOD95646.1 30S ribosomal protein S8 [Candidatus Hydrogenedentota bacterium]HOH43083.1 30S ribosomal protein S8 [Candidatus Hydrogenedentota bacterium]HOM47134.1 30S ribosomal protein S8 [Candidatus Hydrogenedentota bacterium]